MMKYGVVLIILLCVIIYRITLMRNVEADVFTNMYAYIAGCMPLLTLHLNDAISSLRTYGAMSLNGFLYPIFFVFNYLHITMNAYVTLFYYFYIDFGYFGIALGSFVFGFLCMKSYKSWKRNGNVRSLVTYLILIQFIVFSVARIYTGLSTRALSLVWLFLLFRKVRIGMSEKGGRV